MTHNRQNSNISILGFVSILYFIEPTMTILGFTVIKSPLVFQSIILFQMILGCLCVAVFIRKSTRKRNLPYIFSFASTIAFAFLYIAFAEESPVESIVFTVRIVASFGFFLLGLTQSGSISDDDIWQYLCKIPIIGVLLGEVTYFTVISLGYTMTHSISAYAAIPGLVYLMVVAKNGLLISLAILLIILMTGKSTIVIVVTILIITLTIRRWWPIYLTVFFLLIIFGTSIYQLDVVIPTKTGIRITILLKAIARNEVSFELLNNISSSRLYEVEQILSDWRSSRFSLFFGLGTDTTVIKAGTGVANSTIHMSFLKILTSFGVLSIPMLLLTISFLIRSIIVTFGWSRYSIIQVVTGLSVATGLLMANFQFTLFQNSHLWIFSGILLARFRPKYSLERPPPIFHLRYQKGTFSAK